MIETDISAESAKLVFLSAVSIDLARFSYSTLGWQYCYFLSCWGETLAAVVCPEGGWFVNNSLKSLF